VGPLLPVLEEWAFPLSPSQGGGKVRSGVTEIVCEKYPGTQKA